MKGFNHMKGVINANSGTSGCVTNFAQYDVNAERVFSIDMDLYLDEVYFAGYQATLMNKARS